MSKIVYLLYRFSNILYKLNIPFIPKIITIIIRIIFSGWIPASAKIGQNCTFGKGALGIVIHEMASIGNCCIISHNVTIGGSSKKEQGKLPKIGNNVRIGANSVLLGDINIGDEVIIAAGSIVTTDVRSKSIVAGNPAKTIKNNIDINEYVTFHCKD